MKRIRGRPGVGILFLVIGLAVAASMSPPARAAGTWVWPVTGPVIQGFDPPASPYGAGHRGIDIAVPVGTPILAPAPGVVSFAGRVAGSLFVSIDHGAGLISTSSYLSAALVAKGDPVVAGQEVGRSGPGHAGATTPHLHLGIRLGGIYVDPLDYLAPLSLVGLVRLAPMLAPAPTSGPASATRPAQAPAATSAPVPRSLMWERMMQRTILRPLPP